MQRDNRTTSTVLAGDEGEEGLKRIQKGSCRDIFTLLHLRKQSSPSHLVVVSRLFLSWRYGVLKDIQLYGITITRQEVTQKESQDGVYE